VLEELPKKVLTSVGLLKSKALGRKLLTFDVDVVLLVDLNYSTEWQFLPFQCSSLSQSLQKQVSVMSMNLSCKLDDLQRGDRHMETSVALCEIRTQLQELTKSVESCQSEVSEVRIQSEIV
jgi:hypothetical protein